jgi:hypothetical protein
VREPEKKKANKTESFWNCVRRESKDDVMEKVREDDQKDRKQRQG